MGRNNQPRYNMTRERGHNRLGCVENKRIENKLFRRYRNEYMQKLSKRLNTKYTKSVSTKK